MAQHQHLKAAFEGRRTVMQQGKVATRMGVLRGCDHVLERGDDRAKDIQLIEPVRHAMDAHQ